MDDAHRVREAQRHRGREPQPELDQQQRTGEEPRAGEPGVALEAPPRHGLGHFLAAALDGVGGAGAAATLTASTTPSTAPACSADTTNRW